MPDLISTKQFESMLVALPGLPYPTSYQLTLTRRSCQIHLLPARTQINERLNHIPYQPTPPQISRLASQFVTFYIRVIYEYKPPNAPIDSRGRCPR